VRRHIFASGVKQLFSYSLGGDVIKLDPRSAMLLLILACGAACGRAAPAPRPDILLITVDTLRKDHLSSYGYEHPTTPFIDHLAETGVRFTNSYSTSCWTVPAVASLMTSLHPDSHGVVSGSVVSNEVHGQQILAEELPRLPELLREAGYRTFGITANGHLAAELGYAQGFDRYENLGFGAVAHDINRKLEEWKEELDAASPYFLWLHYFDPHAPYRPHESWLSRFASRLPVEEPDRLVVNNASRYLGMGISKRSSEFKYVIALYDGEINHTDGAIRDAVRLLDPASESLVIVTSDHGEEFLEHHRFGHQDALWQELVEIPLVLRFPGERHAGVVVEDGASLVDIGPSLIDYIGGDIPVRAQGASFMPAVEGREQNTTGPVISSLSRYKTRRIDAIMDRDWKLILYGGTRHHELLYNLKKDPQERTNLAASNLLKKAELTTRLQEELSRLSDGVDPSVAGATGERLQELRSLGYVE
jgi:arylsulfatase A-like enzyme